MPKWKGLDIEAEGSGISEPLSRNVNLLGSLLGHAIREQAGTDLFELVEDLRTRCKEAARKNNTELREEILSEIKDLDLEEIVWLLRSYAAFFHLVNKAEQLEINRINRDRAKKADPENPRQESIAAAIHQLKEEGYSYEEVMDLLGQLDIQPTLTAHPTEARRRSILYKQQKVASLLSQLSFRDVTPREEEDILEEVYHQISLLLTTDEIRVERPTVLDEVHHGLYFFGRSIWETVPQIVRDVQLAMEEYYGKRPDIPQFLQYRSWIGGDRDGNPKVTPQVTRDTIRVQRVTALRRYLEDLQQLRRVMSVSDRKVEVPDRLYDSISEDADEIDLPEERQRYHRHEPYRQKLSYMIIRLQRRLDREETLLREEGSQIRVEPPQYRSDEFLEDLQLIKECLEESGIESISESRPLESLIVQARTFGFHIAALDFREHSSIHEDTVAAMLRRAGVTSNYEELSEDERLAVLHEELQNPRPLISSTKGLPKMPRRTIETFQFMRYLIEEEGEPQVVGSYIISMTHEVSDVLEVLLLAKETGLWRLEEDGTVESDLDVVPLFETIEDLDRAASLMEQLYTDPIYQLHVEAQDDFQEIMLGYSDSNKDGGYWMANWALHKAQASLARASNRHDIDMRLFHGRGGTVGRGGGRANQAILSLPPESHNGSIRFTEQGEVISFRYAQPAIARRHLEQIVNAMLRATPSDHQQSVVPETEPSEQTQAMMDRIAHRSMEAYRNLIEDDTFWPWYTQSTPIEQISRLPLASRPISRKSTREVDFEGLRAIPWVFAWTQTRYNIPGWYGIGDALGEYIDEDPSHLDQLRELYENWSFFRAIVNNAEREMARARFPIALLYAQLGEPDWHASLNTSFDEARDAILSITGEDELLDKNRVIQKSIQLRNPYTDVLNLLQVELLTRWRKRPEDERESIREALFLSINGIAAAMQSTG